MEIREIAACLAISPSATYKRLYRALAKLRAALERMDIRRTDLTPLLDGLRDREVPAWPALAAALRRPGVAPPTAGFRALVVLVEVSRDAIDQRQPARA
jgi:hypothetical protein